MSIETLTIKIQKFQFAKKTILSKVGFSVPKCSVVAVVGPNGAGKTTLLNLLFRPKMVEALGFKLGSSDLTNLTSKEYASFVSYLGASDFSQPIITLSDFFKSSCYYSEFNKDRFDICLINWQIYDLKNQLVSSLSLGQFQRLLLAITCYQESELYMFDEPERHLDPQGVKILSSLLAEKKQQSKTVLFASHDLNMALSIADYFVGINENGEQQFCCDKELISKGGYLDDLFQTKFQYLESAGQERRVFI